ncbi:unnamed protein product [Prorocentrum cordatum]|uniref:Uncharacterized protein n=1 Tax=Prorocentrum cordatum TaxID=2364126 RepID=A0ABN9PHM6_9DINO|nr:unnamed protein product [Polarella glacialis]
MRDGPRFCSSRSQFAQADLLQRCNIAGHFLETDMGDHGGRAMDAWVSAVLEVCPSVSEAAVRLDLSRTGNPAATANRMLDGAVPPARWPAAKATGCASGCVDLRSPPRGVPALAAGAEAPLLATRPVPRPPPRPTAQGRRGWGSLRPPGPRDLAISERRTATPSPPASHLQRGSSSRCSRHKQQVSEVQVDFQKSR